MPTEEMSKAMAALWEHTLKNYDAEIIRTSTLIAINQFNYPPTPRQMLDIVESEFRKKKWDDEMKIREQTRLLGHARSKITPRKVLDARLQMWQQLGMARKVQEVMDDIARLDRKENGDREPCEEVV